MNSEQISDQVNTIFKQVFKNEKKLILNKNTSAKDISSWDSLNHVILIDSIEKHFNVTFDLEAMLSMETINDICFEVEKRLNSNK